MSEKPPKDIQKSIRSGNREHLSAAGRKGAEATNQKRALEKEIAEIQAERAAVIKAAEDRAQAESANEHIIDPDGNDQDFHPDNVEQN